jgi:ABC-type transport system involved in multi-copper enzyme maturation permease subunit
VASIFVGVSALLLMAHEYRYNTIMYSLTLSNSRTKFLASKLITVFIYITIVSAIYSLLGLGGLILGTHLGGQPLPHQDINVLHYVLKSVFACVAYGLFGLLFAVLLRTLVAAIALLLLGPGPIEALIGLVLKHNAQYLPFTALGQVTASTEMVKSNGYLTPSKSALLVVFYLAVSWLVAWLLFLKRDAN